MSIRSDEEIDSTDKIYKTLDEEKDEGASETKHDGEVEENNLSCDVNDEQSNAVIEAGSYYLGPIVKKYFRHPVTQCLARKKGTDEYYLMKILVLKDGCMKDKFHLHCRGVFHTEYTILSLLKGHPGVIQLYDFFKDSVPDQGPSNNSQSRPDLKRICMVLECLIPHGSHNAELIPLPEYLTSKRRLTETEALHVFVNILSVIEDLHNRSIVHKDLTLSNVVLNRKTLQVKLINFYYASVLSSESEMSHCQRGNPSYTPPDAIAGKPVSPKPCDMWSAGVILYTMLHGYLPFIGNPSWGAVLANARALPDLYSKIATNDCVISEEICASDGVKRLIRGLLCKDPRVRLKASEALDMACTVLALESSSQTKNLFGCSQYSDQIVPECPKFEQKQGSPSNCTECWLIVNANVPNVTSKTYKIAISEVDGKSPRVSKHKPVAKASKSQDQALSSEKDLLSRSSQVKSSPMQRRSSMSRNNKIKFAMLRLGATSVNNISALSFNYSDRNTSRSQL